MNEFNCPHCNRIIAISKGGTERQALRDHFGGREFEFAPFISSTSGVPADWQPTFEPRSAITERRTPIRALKIEPDVLVPAAKSLGTGIACSIFGILLSMALPGEIEYHAKLVNIDWIKNIDWYWHVASFFGGMAVSWLVFLRDGRDFLFSVEEYAQVDLNGNGHIGKPEPTPEPLKLKVEIKEHKHTDFLDVPQDKAILFAKGVLVNGSMSETSWKHTFGGIKEYKEFRDKLLKAQLIAWKNDEAKAQGLTITRRGLQVFTRLASLKG